MLEYLRRVWRSIRGEPGRCVMCGDAVADGATMCRPCHLDHLAAP